MVLVGYGGLRQTIDYARQDGKAATGWVIDQAERIVGVPAEVRIARRRLTPAPTRLKWLFDGVQTGQLTAASAVERAEEMLEDYGEPADTIALVKAAVHSEVRAIAPTGPTPRRRHRTRETTREVGAVPGRRLRVVRDPGTGRVQYIEE